MTRDDGADGDDASPEPTELTLVTADGRRCHVRPLGADPTTPVVRQLGDRPLYHGNRLAAGESHADRFRHVLSLTADPQPATTEHVPLVDGEENAWADFAAAVDAARRLHDAEGSLLVHCAVGVSRSTAVLAALLAVAEDRPVREAMELVLGVRRHAVPNPHLHEQAVCYAAAHR